ncbi:hypothetical protein ABZV33_27360, partial [Streptomyces microflavus]
MTKKTRVRLARIAAGAVIAAGASLTAAGAAQAVGLGIGVDGDEIVTADAGIQGDENPIGGADQGGVSGETTTGETTTGETTGET